MLRGIIAVMPKTPLKTLDVVALLVDKPEERLVTGQVGTVVEVLAPMSRSWRPDSRDLAHVRELATA